MAIIRKQFKKAGIDFKDPTPEELVKVVDYLIKAASTEVEEIRLAAAERAYMDLIRRIV